MPNELAPQAPLRVAVRVRPVLGRDGDGPACASYGLDGFSDSFDGTSSQHDVFQRCAAPQVRAVLDGLDACIFAFGQTGAGKTYTMIGAEGGRAGCHDSAAGILPLACGAIFGAIAQLEQQEQSRYRLSVCYVEVHREGVFDLLVPDRPKCGIRENDEGVYVESATTLRIRSIAAMLHAVAKGSARRRTAETGVHAHSSRSHAVLTLTLEKRWRTGKVVDGAHCITCRTSSLRLVDLAGSEGMAAWDGHGATTADGIATNLGLHVLGRCITALAAGEGHVPYRDSTLTRLLRPALAGRCQTQMIACVSPAEADASETGRVLHYARSAQKLVGKPEVRLADELEPDPMAGDVADDDETLARRCLWLQVPGWGEVFARAAGDPTRPLILFVHGSGSENSSRTWNDCVADVGRRLAATRKQAHCLVAIDCPGYGRSPGDRQTIRSYPAAFLAAVVRACGHHRAACLVGSSQGAASIFNAALELPKLTERLAVCHPVGHAVERYSALVHPTLLAFDVDDDGHPVTVGRRMRAVLPKPTYFEFSSGRGEERWLQRHFADELVTLLVHGVSPWPKHRGKELPVLARLAGGLRMWATQREGEYGSWYSDSKEEPEEPPQGGGPEPEALPPAGSSEDVLFSDSEASDVDAVEATEARAAAEALQRERCQTQCDLMGCRLGAQPIRLSSCRHALCGLCAMRSVYLFRECPVCGEALACGKKATGMPDVDTLSISAQPIDASDGEDAAQRVAKAKAKAKQALLLEYGNTASPKGTKTSFKTFVRVVSGKGAIKKVAFNINPSFDRPTEVVERPNGPQSGFVFEYAMARVYPCHMRVEFAKDVPPVVIRYYVRTAEELGGASCFARRIALEMPVKLRGNSGTIVVDAEDSPRSVWVNNSGKVIIT